MSRVFEIAGPSESPTSGEGWIPSGGSFMGKPHFGRWAGRQDHRPRDQRTAHRYSAVEGQARFGWWEDETFQDRGALMLDISQHGMLLVTDEAPARGREV